MKPDIAVDIRIHKILPRYCKLTDAVQEALVKALQLWPFQGAPEDPAAWLFQVARNAALDRLRRASH